MGAHVVVQWFDDAAGIIPALSAGAVPAESAERLQGLAYKNVKPAAGNKTWRQHALKAASGIGSAPIFVIFQVFQPGLVEWPFDVEKF